MKAAVKFKVAADFMIALVARVGVERALVLREPTKPKKLFQYPGCNIRCSLNYFRGHAGVLTWSL